ncbi:hypothetical protein ABPG74_009660 [Tetrahymena malaccensis]
MINIRFEAKVHTSFGQKVVLVGNHPQLGDWQPTKGLSLSTFEGLYPIWRSEQEFRIPEGFDLEFKIIVVNGNSEVDHWENLPQNRTYTPSLCKESVLLRMHESSLWIEEFYDGPVDKIHENSLKNYTRIMAPMKIRSSRILNPKIVNQPTKKQEEKQVRKAEENSLNSESITIESNSNKGNEKDGETKKLSHPLKVTIGDGLNKNEIILNQQKENLEQIENLQEEEQANTIKYFYKQIASKSDSILVSTHVKAQRLKNELKQLAKSLPIQSSNSIFLVYDEQRLDVMRALIFGSEDTPYAHGAYFFDIFIPDDYPQNPPKVSIVSTKNNSIRFNPNLYADGLVCISLLGTWEGEQSENWDPTNSNIYQILISIQSLIMNEDVYFNEPYYQEWKGTEQGNKCNRAYSNIVKYFNIQHAIGDMIENPPYEFQQVIYTHFLLKREAIKATAQEWIEQAKKGEECLYDELIEDHNQQISSKFSSEREAYLQSLQEEVERVNKLLDSLDERLVLISS